MVEVERCMRAALLFLQLVDKSLVLVDPEVDEVRGVSVGSFLKQDWTVPLILMLRRSHTDFLSDRF